MLVEKCNQLSHPGVMPINHIMTKEEINPQMGNNTAYILRITKSCLTAKKTVKFER